MLPLARSLSVKEFVFNKFARLQPEDLLKYEILYSYFQKFYLFYLFKGKSLNLYFSNINIVN